MNFPFVFPGTHHRNKENDMPPSTPQPMMDEATSADPNRLQGATESTKAEINRILHYRHAMREQNFQRGHEVLHTASHLDTAGNPA